MRLRIASVIALVALATACSAPTPTARVERVEPAPAALWISDVAVLDVATGERTPARDVLVRDGRIVSIAETGAAEAPESAWLVQGRGATLMPGLIDAHGHIYMHPAPRWENRFPDPEGALHSYLYSGVTTVLDPSDASGEAVERRERVARGEEAGPRIFTSGRLHTAVEGHPISLVRQFAPGWIAWYLVPRVAVAVASEAEARAAADALAASGADFLKLVIDAIPLEAPTLRQEVVRALVEQARTHGIRSVAHIGTTEDAIAAAEAGVAAWMHGVYKERIPDEQIAALAAYGIPMVATLEVFDNYARAFDGPRLATRLEREVAPPELLHAFYPPPDDLDGGALVPWLEMNVEAGPARLENVRRLHEAGVTILAGSDSQSGVFPGPGLHRELAQLVRAGLTPVEAIRAATLDTARFLQQRDDPDFGNVAVGQRADLLLVEGDPTRDIGAVSRIRAVFQRGAPVRRHAVDAG